MSLSVTSPNRWQRWLSCFVRGWVSLTIVGAGLVSSSVLWGAPVHAGTLTYEYDDAGRLIGVVDEVAGLGAIYQYDAVGNLLKITRKTMTSPTLLNFTPKSGPVGTTVTIVGMGFSPTPAKIPSPSMARRPR